MVENIEPRYANLKKVLFDDNIITKIHDNDSELKT
jgi:hypothetical protein